MSGKEARSYDYAGCMFVAAYIGAWVFGLHDQWLLIMAFIAFATSDILKAIGK